MSYRTLPVAARVLAQWSLAATAVACAPDDHGDPGFFAGPAIVEERDAGVGRADARAPEVVNIDAAAPSGPELDAGVSDAGGDASAPDAGASSPTPSVLAFRVTTTTLGGHYAPRNIGAIWIETVAGVHVRTLARWADKRLSYLTAFIDVSGGNATDAVTSATLREHTEHTVTWNLKDKLGKQVPEGVYRIRLQMTESHALGAVGQIAFIKGKQPVTLTAPDQAGLTAMSLRYE